MRTSRAWPVLAASTVVAALVAAGGSASAAPTADPGPDTDLERVPGTVTGIPAPADPLPSSPRTRSGAAAVSTDLMSRRLQSRSQSLVPTFGGRVMDVASGETIWSRGSAPGLVPASATKVLTGYTALKTLGPSHRYSTTVHQAKSWRSYIYLKGSGDPTLSTYRLKMLAATTASTVRAEGIRTVTLRVDDSAFPKPTNAVGWQTGDVPRYVAPVRALVVDQRNSMDTSMDAAQVFADALKARGVSVRSISRGQRTSTSREIATRPSPLLRTIVRDMLRESQNDYAEALLWTSGLAAGASPTWAGVTGHVRQTVRSYGVTTMYTRLHDGSGLSRSNRVSAVTLASLTRKLYADPTYRPLVYSSTGMPVAGRTGTLKNRFSSWPSSCAVDKVRAKTGSLRDVTVLTGIATGRDGRVRSFAFIANGRANTAAVRTRLDELAATVVGCW